MHHRLETEEIDEGYPSNPTTFKPPGKDKILQESRARTSRNLHSEN